MILSDSKGDSAALIICSQLFLIGLYVSQSKIKHLEGGFAITAMELVLIINCLLIIRLLFKKAR